MKFRWGEVEGIIRMLTLLYNTCYHQFSYNFSNYPLLNVFDFASEWMTMNKCNEKRNCSQFQKDFYLKSHICQHSATPTQLQALLRVTPLALMLTNVGLRDNFLCDRSNLGEETVEHLICCCPAWQTERKVVFGKSPIQPQEVLAQDPVSISSF